MKKQKNILLLLILLLSFNFLKGKGKSIDFSEMIRNCKLIAIVEFKGGNLKRTKFDLVIETVLKGKTSKKEITVEKAESCTPHLTKGKRCIAFINSHNQFEWVGLSNDIENKLIFMEGFYDYNSYDVWP